MLPVIDHFIFEVDPNNTYIKIKISINLNAVSKINIRTAIQNVNLHRIAVLFGKSEFFLGGWLFNVCSLSQYVYVSTFGICVNFCTLRNKLLLESRV